MRINWIDNLKGFAITLVVIGHVISGLELTGICLELNYSHYFFNLIYAFHMPLFFCISGMVYKIAYLNDDYTMNVKSEKNQKRRIANYVWIYFIFSIGKVILKFVMPNQVLISANIFDLLLLPLKPIAPYWYLYVLVVIYVLMPHIMKVSNKKMVLLIALIISCVVFCAKETMLSSFGGVLVLKYFFFFLLGVFYTDIRELCFTNSKKLTVAFIACAVISFFSGLWEDYSFSCEIIELLCGTTISIWCIWFFEKFMNKVSLWGYIGSNTLVIFTLHMFLMGPTRILIRLLKIENYILGTLVSTILSIMTCIVFGIIVKKIRISKGKTLYNVLYEMPSIVIQNL